MSETRLNISGVISNLTLRKLLLLSGIASSVLYIAATVFGAMQWDGYNWASQSVSELFALDAPSRVLVATSFLAYGFLVIAFGWGVWMSAGSRRSLRATGLILILYGIVGFPGPLFFSLHTIQRGVQAETSDILHAIITIALVLAILSIVGFGSSAFGRRFRLYSFSTIITIVVFGAFAGMDGAKMVANLPTPWLGVTERINIFSFMLWVIVLAIGLLRNISKRTANIREVEVA